MPRSCCRSLLLPGPVRPAPPRPRCDRTVATGRSRSAVDPVRDRGHDLPLLVARCGRGCGDGLVLVATSRSSSRRQCHPARTARRAGASTCSIGGARSLAVGPLLCGARGRSSRADLPGLVPCGGDRRARGRVARRPRSGDRTDRPGPHRGDSSALGWAAARLAAVGRAACSVARRWLGGPRGDRAGLVPPPPAMVATRPGSADHHAAVRADGRSARPDGARRGVAGGPLRLALERRRRTPWASAIVVPASSRDTRWRTCWRSGSPPVTRAPGPGQVPSHAPSRCIIVPCHDDADRLPACLAALRDQTYAERLVLVVDIGSPMAAPTKPRRGSARTSSSGAAEPGGWSRRDVGASRRGERPRPMISSCSSIPRRSSPRSRSACSSSKPDRRTAGPPVRRPT